MDIKVFILTVVENSGMCKFSRVCFIKFENEKKSSEIISTYISNFLQYIFNLFLCYSNIYSPFYFQFLFFTTKKRTKFFSHYFYSNYR